MLAEDALHGLGFVRAEHAVVHKDARELVADRLVQERRSHRTVHAAAQAEDDVIAADFRADAGARFLDEGTHRPVRRRAADFIHEIFQQLLAARRVDDLGVELQPVEMALRILDDGERRIVRAADGAEAAREFGELVAVRIPDVHRLAEPVEERALVGQLELAVAVLALPAVLHLAAEEMRHELHAVADAEDGQPEGENRAVGMRRVLCIHGRRAAAEDDALRI